MRLFGKGENSLPEGQVRLAERIAGKILRLQRYAADFLNMKTAKFSANQWWVMLVVFSLLFGGYSLYLLVEAIY